MFEDPAFPSMPPSSEDQSVKPMSVLGAFMWATGAMIVFLWLITASRMLKGEESFDMIGGLLCQVAAFLFVLYLVLRVHAPNTPIRSLLAIRKSNPWFWLLAPIIGVCASYPSYKFLELIYSVYPPEEQVEGWLDLFKALSQPEQVVVAIGTVVIAPFMEEVLFRGALYRPMRIDKSPAVVILVTAFLFAGAHLELQKMPPLFVMGAVLGYMRWASGSLIPPFLIHMGYNSVAIVETLLATEEQSPPISLVTGGLGIMAVALLFTHALASSSRRASAARRDDN
jgi:membrane protease YdiL (CAAX protease family)